MCTDDSYEIMDKDMEKISGGVISGNADAKAEQCTVIGRACPPCPNCGSTNTYPYPGLAGLPYACGDCTAAFG